MRAASARAYGVARSLVTYHGQPWRNARRRLFYGQFVRPGRVAFDIGAHVGDRIRCWRSLGARVLAVEPQPDFAWLLRRFFGRDPGVTVLACGIGREAARATLRVSSRTPTVSSFSDAWMKDVQRDPRFARIAWDRAVEVELCTLDALIERFGEPCFVKLDVEGMERDALAGLTRPLPALSFEYIPLLRARAAACIDRVVELGDYRFRRSEVETTRWAEGAWLDAQQMKRALDALPDNAGSGDVYAVRAEEIK
jgi:FkbM family methyltransferase